MTLSITKSGQREFLIASAWWVFWLFAQLIAFHRIGFSWKDSFYDSAIATAVLMTTGFVIANTFRYYRPVSNNFILLTGYVFIITAIAGRLIFWFSSKTMHEDPLHAEKFAQYLPLRGLFFFVMIAFVTAYYYYKNKLEEQGNSRQREKEAGILMRDAELARLRQQLQPHFLFNSLNSISALAGSKPEQARQMIQQLSDFLRGTMRKDDNQLVPLSEELHLLGLYLDIEKVRFGHRLNTSIEFDEAASSMTLPPLLLQPIVENAVKFGLYDTTDAVTITIRARAENNQLYIFTQNPFDPSTARPASGTGFGLTSVQRRLYLLYGRNDLLETETTGSLFITKLKIPQSS